jgi:UDP-N-acetylmuramyl pentapeptide synthase
MNKQTAVEWLFNQIKKSSEKKDNINNDHLFFYRMLEQAIAMEKEQIIDAYGKDRVCVNHDGCTYMMNGEQYYNETYEN